MVVVLVKAKGVVVWRRHGGALPSLPVVLVVVVVVVMLLLMMIGNNVNNYDYK